MLAGGMLALDSQKDPSSLTIFKGQRRRTGNSESNIIKHLHILLFHLSRSD